MLPKYPLLLSTIKSLESRIKEHVSSVTATLPLIAQVIFYYTDTIKDIIFFYALLQIAQHQHDFASIAMQFAVAAGLSVLMPHILNMALFLAKWSPGRKSARREKGFW